MRNGITQRLTLVMLAILLLASPAFAATKPSELESAVKASEPYGQARLTRFLFHVYDAQIWTDAPAWSYQEPFALSVTYAMSFSAPELTQSTLQQAQKVSTLSQAEEKQFALYLDQAYRDVKSGERVTALFMPPDNITFFVNGIKTLSMKDAVFARAFFDIWLSERTSEPSLRTGLLGLHS